MEVSTAPYATTIIYGAEPGTIVTKSPESLAIGVVLGWIDVDVKLRVRSPPPVVAKNPVRASQKKPRAVRFFKIASNPLMSKSLLPTSAALSNFLFPQYRVSPHYRFVGDVSSIHQRTESLGDFPAKQPQCLPFSGQLGENFAETRSSSPFGWKVGSGC